MRDGDHVQASDVLVRIDDTITRANLAIVVKQLDELSARKARLEAERDGSPAVVFPEHLVSRREEPDGNRLITGESRLFDLRRTSRLGQQAQLRRRIEQLSEEICGQRAQAAAKAQEIALIERELAGARELWRRT